MMAHITTKQCQMYMELDERYLNSQDGTIAHAVHLFYNQGLVGCATIYESVNPDQPSYLADMFILEHRQRRGAGTTIIEELAKRYSILCFAPTNKENERLCKRIAKRWDMGDEPEIDQGYGVYYIG